MDERVARRRAVDVALAAGTAVLGIAEIWMPLPSVAGDGSKELSTAVVLVLAALLVFRRAAPLWVAIALLAIWPVVFTITPVLVLFWGQFLPMTIAVFSVARFGRDREPVYGALAGAAALLFFDLRVDVLQEPSEIVFHWLVFTVAWSFGWGLRSSEQRARASTQRAVDAEVRTAQETMAAVAAERTRIARELHDIIAHSVTVMVVQAGAAEQLVDDDPAVARKALQTIRSTGTAALAEMRRVVEVLRDGETGMLAPQPGVDALPSLVEEARETGLATTLHVEGEPRPLSPGLDLTAYRIVQESLTNARRHAEATGATVLLRYGDAEIDVEVRDDGVGASGNGSGGHGLAGMRERVSLYGGELVTESAEGGGFRVRARLPVEPT